MIKFALCVPCLIALAALALLAAAPVPSTPLEPVNLAFNTADDEDDPFVASDGRTMYYSVRSKGKWDLMIASRQGGRGLWGKGEALGDYVQTSGDDRSCCATPEKQFPQYLYFATTKDREGEGFDLYVAIKRGPDRAFTSPAPLHSIDTKADEMAPWLTADGRTLYFSRKTKEGWRVFEVSRRPGTTQDLGKPELVKDLPPDFHHVTLTRDGRTMYLQGPLGKGRTGLFIATKTRTGWSKPEPLEGLNHPDAKTGDRSPSLSRDGSVLYFASDRPGGKGGLDVWGIPTAKLKKK